MLFSFLNDPVFHSVYVNIITILLSTLQILPGSEHNEIQWRIRVLCSSLEQPLFESHRGWASTFCCCCFKFHEIMSFSFSPLHPMRWKTGSRWKYMPSKHSYIRFYSDEIKVGCYCFYFLEYHCSQCIWNKYIEDSLVWMLTFKQFVWLLNSVFIGVGGEGT